LGPFISCKEKCFEKVEETDTNKVKNDTPKRNDTQKEKQIHSLDEVKKPKEKTTLNDAQRKAESLARKRHAKEFQNRKHLS